MRHKSSILGMAALAVVLALPPVRASAAAATAPAGDVTKSMQQAKQTAYQLRETADRLHAITRSGGHSWQSHSWYLNAAREDVNRLGKMLADLEGLKPLGTEAQQVIIERMRPQLVATAGAFTNAIELLNDRRHNAYFAEYREAVQTVSEQGDALHETLDAVLDYEAAKFRLNSLKLLPSAQSGT
jgi:hypothetical protein